MKRQLSSLLLAVALLAAGCSAVFRQPVVTVERFRLESLGLRGGTLVARVHVENPNGFDLRTDRLDYTIEVAESDTAEDVVWRPLATGEFLEEVRVPANSAAYVDIPIEFSFGDMGGLCGPFWIAA